MYFLFLFPPPECCLFVFFDGSAYYFDDYLRLLTGPYRLMYGTVNGHPHYVARGCKEPGEEFLCFKRKSLHDTAIFRKKSSHIDIHGTHFLFCNVRTFLNPYVL